MILFNRKIRSAHVLIARTDNIGDIVLTLPMAARLKQLQPGVKITLLCRTYAAQAAQYCDDIDEVVQIEDVQQDLSGWLRSTDIDTIILAQPDRKLAIAAFKAGVRHRIGNARQKLYQLIYCNRRVRFSKGRSDNHEAQINFEFLRPYGETRIPEREAIDGFYRFTIPHDDGIANLLRPHAFNLVLHTKSNGHGREWPVSHYVELAQILGARRDVHLWLTGTEQEGKWIAEHAPQLLAQPNVSSVLGQLNLARLMSFIRQADGLIAGGTGPLHLSAAIGQRTLGLFPPTRPMHAGRWAALGRQASNLSLEHPQCLDCHKTPGPSCACMEAITPQQVEQVVVSWLRDKPRVAAAA